MATLSNQSGARPGGSRLRTLGALWLVYGLIRLITGVCLFVFMVTATLMFGALLSRAPDPFTLMSIFHFVYAAIIVVAFVSGVLGILAGFSLLSGSGSARMLALIAAFLSLASIPLGTTLGIYTLIVFLRTGPAD